MPTGTLLDLLLLLFSFCINHINFFLSNLFFFIISAESASSLVEDTLTLSFGFEQAVSLQRRTQYVRKEQTHRKRGFVSVLQPVIQHTINQHKPVHRQVP